MAEECGGQVRRARAQLCHYGVRDSLITMAEAGNCRSASGIENGSTVFESKVAAISTNNNREIMM